PCGRASGQCASARGSAAVVLLQVVCGGLGVAVADRRAESLDHLGDLGIPHSRTWERRVHLNVVEAVARGVVLLDHVEAGSFFEINRLLMGDEWRCKQCGEECRLMRRNCWTCLGGSKSAECSRQLDG